MFRLSFLSFLAVLLLQLAVDAYPTGAGDCPAKTAAVGGSHLTATTITDGDLNDYGVELLINGQSLKSSAPFDVPIGQDHVWELVSSGFRGFLLRLDGGEGTIDTIDALGPLSGMGGMVQVAEVCTSQGVGGVTHRSRVLKNATSGFLRLDQESLGMNLDVTVVIKNANGQAEHYYSSYTLNAVASVNPAPVPSPTTRRPTPAPVPRPTTKRPTMYPVQPPTTRRPIPAPVPAPVPKPTSKAPVTMEAAFQGDTFSPTFTPTTYPSFGTMDLEAPSNPLPPPEPAMEPTFGDVTGEDVNQGTTFSPTFMPSIDPLFDETGVAAPTNPLPPPEPVLEPTVDGESLVEDGATTVILEPFLISVIPSCSVNNTCGICEGEVSNVISRIALYQSMMMTGFSAAPNHMCSCSGPC
jgi:hypothetical protein